MAETNDILEVAKMTISTSIKCNTVRGFIGWHSCDNICMDMHDVLDMCEDAFKRERYQESLEADTYVLVSGVKLASCADSSSGMLTDVIMRAFELIDLSTQTIAKLDAAMRKHALSLIIKEAKKKALLKYFGSVEKIRNSSIEEIVKVNGINEELAKNILHQLN